MLRLALAGLGEIGRTAHLPALLRHAGVDLVAIADPVAPQRDRAAALVGEDVRVYVGLDEVLDDGGVDGVVLATPPWVTPDLAVTALRAGTYVLAEKPVATSAAAAAAYDVLTPGELAHLQVGLTYRHDPAIRTLAGWVRDGRLGAPLLARAHVYDERHDATDAEHRDRIVRALASGPPVVHEGSHVLDWLAVILATGEPDVADAWALTTAPGLPNPNVVGARLTYADGAAALVEFGWLTDALPRCEIGVLGQAGYAVLDARTFRLELTTAGGSEHHEYAGDRTARCFDAQLDRFVELVSGGRERPEPGLAAGLAALRLSERIATTATERTAP